MQKVTLINISLPFREEENDTYFLPIEALNICANLESQDYEVELVDYQTYYTKVTHPFSPENIRGLFQNSSKKIVAVTTNDASAFAILLLKYLKKEYPDKQIILGGFGVNGVEEEILKEFPFIDIVVLKNCEVCYGSALKYLEQASQEPLNCVYRKNGQTIRKESDFLSMPLDEQPLPSYDKVDLQQYQEVMLRTSSGCPFQCTFCQRKGKLVQRDLEQVIQEIRMLRDKYGQKRFFFYDQTFILNRKRVIDFCQRLKEEKLTDIEWSCTGRVNLVDDDLLKTMKECGCIMMYFGVESGSERVLQRIKKNITIKQVSNANKIAAKYFNVNNFIIWGFPFETMEDFEKTVELIGQLKETNISPIVYMCSLFPATKLCHTYRNQMFFLEECWDYNWSHKFMEAALKEEMKEIIRRYPIIFSGFYVADPNILTKLERISKLEIDTHYPDV